MMDDIFDGPLPKGMHIPMPEEPVYEEPSYLTHVEVNYSKLIREALAGIKDVDVQVVKLMIDESMSAQPIVSLDLQICPRG